MLQIATGRIFEQSAGRENPMRGTLFTNLVLPGGPEHEIRSPLFGRIVQTTEIDEHPRSTVYEFTERLEDGRMEPGVVISWGADAYVEDMGVLVSFFFDCTCSRDRDLVRRLLANERGLATSLPPNKYVPRTFDKAVYCGHEDAKSFTCFVEHLLCLPREKYRNVIQVIRTHVTGMQRIGDDLDLAYTLLVASAETLATRFVKTTTWADLPEEKRRAVDGALEGAHELVASRVRDALVKVEHASIGPKFRAFMAEYLGDAYFRGPFKQHSHPIGRSELGQALASAYEARSKYVHELRPLPKLLMSGGPVMQTMLIDRKRMFTLHGLARITRHVIKSYVLAQETVGPQPSSYREDIPGILFAPLAPSCWIATVDSNLGADSQKKFEGFLEELIYALMRYEGHTVTDLRAVLHRFLLEEPDMKPSDRLAYYAILFLFNRYAGTARVHIPAAAEKRMLAVLNAPSIAAQIVHAVAGEPPDWPLQEQVTLFRRYQERRTWKKELRIERPLEAALLLELAERFRQSDQPLVCNNFLVEAADTFPEHLGLREVADRGATDQPIRWWSILPLPRTESKPTAPRKKRRVLSPRARWVAQR
ncbi:hypothetical protein [Roseateles cavernae]|uniref:hypothetical protein n=1 Tax=Roseateles cavernae TaxID=3153578 RepID=UPI0032E508C7